MGIAEEKTINFISIGRLRGSSREEEEFSTRTSSSGSGGSSSVAPTDKGYSSNSINDDDDNNEMSSLRRSAKQRSDDYGTHLDTARDFLGDDPLTLSPEKEILLRVRRNVMLYKITDSMKCSPRKMLSIPIDKTVYDN